MSWFVLAIAACSSSDTPSVTPAEQFVAPPPPPPVVARRDERPPIPAWSLTGSDGTGLKLVDVEARAVVEGPLAFTELHLRFENPEDRTREGTFSITLPQHAAVSRFAMEDDGRMVEAEVVPKAIGRLAYDDAVHRGIDPAILEKAAGNAFTARVFPIPAHAIKHIVVSYSQELPNEGYRLPLRGLPVIGRVSADVTSVAPDGSRHVDRLREKQWQPDRDFTTTVASPPAIGAGPLVAGAFELAPGSAVADDPVDSVAILVDTSGARAAGFADYVGRVRELVGLIGAADTEVIAFDQEVAPIFRGPANAFGDAEVAAIVDRDAAGALDLSHALSEVHGKRVIVVGNGIVTAGHDGAELETDLAALHADRIDVVLAGGVRDDHAPARWARAGTRPGDVFDLDGPLGPIVRGLHEQVRVDVPVEVAGATWTYPHVVPALRAGQQVMVFARLAEPAMAFDVSIGGTQRHVALQPGTRVLLDRATAHAEIDELEARLEATPAKDEAAADKLRKTIETKSVAARVVSTQTTMLVLERDADYERYGIDRKALANILVVTAAGLELQRREFIAGLRRPGTGAGADDGSFGLGREGFGPGGGGTGWGTIGLGHYGTIGHGSGTGSGYGVGAGHGSMHARVAAVPTVSIGQPMSMGSLDKNIIRRYIRRHTNQITYCYERELLAHPSLRGVIETEFMIGTDGHVQSASAHGFDTTVASCVATVLEGIEFPPVQDGAIQVHYPFTFRRSDAPDDETASTPAVPTTVAVPEANIPTPSSQAAPDAETTQTVRAPDPVVSNHDAAPRTDAPSAPAIAPTPTRDPAPATDVAPVANAVAVSEPPVAETAAPQTSQPAPVRRTLPDGIAFGPPIDALDGNLARVVRELAHQHVWNALAIARRWHAEQPTDVLAWVGLGLAHEANGNLVDAARAYGSIIDLYPSRAELRRFAGERLEHVGERGRALAIDTFRRAVADRPDHPTGHRLLAYALVRAGDYAGAWKAIVTGASAKHRDDGYRGLEHVFDDDLRMIGTAYAAHGGPRADIAKVLDKHNLSFAGPSTRFILYWETDANDVDLHVTDTHGNHAFFQHLQMESGGALYADITTGYGPECFAIDGAPTAGPYELGVHYYRQGPMGYGMGLVQVERFDGTGFAFEDHPYVIMRDEAYVTVGRAR